MTNIVWVFGSSAAGKETFIRKMLTNPSQKLIDCLGWNNKNIVCVEESLQYIGQFENDPIVEKRKQIVDNVKSIANQLDTVILIKGQDIDFKFDLLNKLRKEISNVKHKIIFLHADVGVLFDRCKKKSWWSKEDEAEGVKGVKEYLTRQINYLQNLNDFEIIAFDSMTYNYKPIKFPPTV